MTEITRTSDAETVIRNRLFGQLADANQTMLQAIAHNDLPALEYALTIMLGQVRTVRNQLGV